MSDMQLVLKQVYDLRDARLTIQLECDDGSVSAEVWGKLIPLMEQAETLEKWWTSDE